MAHFTATPSHDRTLNRTAARSAGLLAAATLLFGFGPLSAEPARRTAYYGALAALAALAVDVYLY